MGTKKPNPYRIEYEHGPVTETVEDGLHIRTSTLYPTLVFFTRPPTRADFKRLTAEAFVRIDGPAQDAASCVFKLEQTVLPPQPKDSMAAKKKKVNTRANAPASPLPPAKLLRATAAYLRDLEERVYNDTLAKGPKVLSSMLEALADVEEAGC